MGFSVTASFIIFGVALLGAFSAASSAYWKSQATLEEAHRAMQERVVKESHASLVIGSVTWNNGTKTESFQLTNSGTTALDITRLEYMFDGVLSYASEDTGYPKLNGANPPSSDLLLSGDTLDCEFTLASQPADIMVITEFGSVRAHSP